MINPLNCGQYVNNATANVPCNVSYQECDLPLEEFPIEWRRYLPNVYYSPAPISDDQQHKTLRIVALVATRAIEEDTELLSTYYTLVSNG